MVVDKISKRKRKPKIENYYKILGTTANAGPKKIKEKYIDKVKKFPPESHPEEFQRIRYAYEILRDPIKRSEYDLMRKYGGKIEKLMEKALACMISNNLKEAEKLLLKVKQIQPNNVQAYMALADIAIIKEDMKEFNEQFDMALSYAQEDIKEMVYALKINRMLVHDFPKEALYELDRIKGYFKNEVILRQLKIDIYKELGKYDELWILIQEEIPPRESQSFEDIDVFIDYLNTAMELGKWSEIPKIKNCIIKLLKSIEDEDDKFIVGQNLSKEYMGYRYAARFREAEIYIDLLYKLDSKNVSIKEERKNTQYLAKLQKEIDRMLGDRELFPYVHLLAMKLFVEEYIPDEADVLMENFPHDYIDEMEEMDEEIAFGIMRVKKKYQLVYKEFRDEWDDMFERHTEGFNREMRRCIRKGRM